MSPVIQSNGRDRPVGPLERKAVPSRAATPSATSPTEVTFQTAEGVDCHARLSRLTRHTATFEAGPLAGTLRTSEVLSHFKITGDRRILYFGRAVVSSVVDTGGSLVAEAKLEGPGSDTAFFKPPPSSAPLAAATYEAFFQDWQKNYRMTAAFKVLVADVESYLMGVRHWLERLEFGRHPEGESAAEEQALLETVAPRILGAFNGRHEEFESLLAALPPESRDVHQEFVRRHWHKLFLGSPFGHRTYHKPLGHAGDYEMMNMIHRNQPEGRSLFEKLIHLLLMSQWPAKSVRNRIAHLGETLIAETARTARTGKIARILNVGCGPAREVQTFLRSTPLSNHSAFTLVDFNEETLAYTGRQLVEAKRECGRHAEIRAQKMSVHELLKRTQRRTGPAEKFDLIYCAGLFDYLAPQTCRALIDLWYDSLPPGGLMLIANMNDTKPFRHFIECVLDWQLIYRDRHQLLSLVPDRCRAATRVMAEPTSVNLFLHIRKPD